ncbi:MAG: ribosomal L7Ae/L30e/S12e/Gadd45 family protein [Erysipelotrichaceae bacterium]|nr:ribosomal L7Ae/L30e/S12e/Gadd45 family protein [Erysipelotrichaceae bacterium]
MAANIANTLGLAKRAGCILVGSKMMDGIRSRKIRMVLLANDASDRTKKVVSDKCRYYEIPCYESLSMPELSLAIGFSHIAAVGITDDGFAKLAAASIEKR